MKRILSYILWGCMYIVCVGLGTVENPQGFGKALLVLTGIIFFLPPGYLLYNARNAGDKKQLLIIRILCILSLALTLVLLVINFLSVGMDAATGMRLYELLNLVSAPMLCCQYWVVSLFLWACLLWGSFPGKKKT